MYKHKKRLSENRKFAVILILGGILSVIIPGLITGLGNYQVNQVYLQEELQPINSNTLQIKTRIGDIKQTIHQPKAKLLIRDSRTLQTVFDGEVVLSQNKWGDFEAVIPRPKNLSSNFVDVLIKPEQHRQLKFKKVILGSSGVLDLTTRVILSGDLPYKDGVQDGKTDQEDYYALVSEIGSQDQVGDLNYDGEVNALDRSILLKNWLNK